MGHNISVMGKVKVETYWLLGENRQDVVDGDGDEDEVSDQVASDGLRDTQDNGGGMVFLFTDINTTLVE